MTSENQPLPEFTHPPVSELALSVLHEPLVDLKTVHLGLLWAGFRGDYPVIEDQGPVAATIESEDLRLRGAAPGVTLEHVNVPQIRTWFLNTPGTELIQIQKDRIGHNWRRVAGESEYPRYATIRARFAEELRTYEGFLSTVNVGGIVPTQCEVTYVNHFRRDAGWDHADVASVVKVWNEYPTEFLRNREDVRFQIRYAIRDDARRFLGRLHVSLQPAWLRENDERILIFTLTARGAPIGSGTDGCLRFMDIGHEWIVRGFADLTTDAMQKAWGRTS